MLKGTIDSKDQIINDYKNQIDDLMRENSALADQKEQLENTKLGLSSKLVHLIYINRANKRS